MTGTTAGGDGDNGPEQPGGRSDPASSMGRDVWPAKRFHPSRAQRIANRVVMPLTRWGLIPHTFILTTKGRKTGQLHSTPATLVEEGEQKWLVAPYGPVSWVLNARAAGRVTVSRRGVSTMYLVTEVSAAEAGPVLKEYLRIAGATRSYFAATKDAPAADFAAEAHHHPVFALTPVE